MFANYIYTKQPNCKKGVAHETALKSYEIQGGSPEVAVMVG